MRVFESTDRELDRLEKVASDCGILTFRDRQALAEVRRLSASAEAELKAKRDRDMAQEYPHA